jgi:hypothetical protein
MYAAHAVQLFISSATRISPSPCLISSISAVAYAQSFQIDTRRIDNMAVPLLYCCTAAQVLGADTPIGQRVALSLAINGARLALFGRLNDKDTMEQVRTCTLYAVAALSIERCCNWLCRGSLMAAFGSVTLPAVPGSQG